MGKHARVWAIGGKWLMAFMLALPLSMPIQEIAAEGAASSEAVTWMNNFDPDVFTGWGLWAGEGSSVKQMSVDGVTGKAVRMDYDRSALGWGLVAHAELPAEWRLDGIKTIQFYAKGDGIEQDFYVGVEEKDGGDKYRKLISISGREWTLVTIPVSELTYQDGGDQHLDWDRVNSINISPEINRSGQVTIDDMTLGNFEPSLTNTFSPDVFGDWGLWAGDGSQITKSAIDGFKGGQGARFDYTRSAAGWGLVAHGSIPADWKLEGTEALSFMIRGDGTERHYSVGVEEKDGGDKFRAVIAVNGEGWTPVTIAASDLAYQDGGGNGQLDFGLVNGINISPEENGSGSWSLDDFTFYKGGLLPPVVQEPSLNVTELTASRAGSVFTGKNITLDAKLDNSGSVPTALTRKLSYTVRDESEAVVLSSTADIPAIAAGGKTDVALSFQVPKYGYYTIEAVMEDDAGVVSARTSAFAAVAPASSSEGTALARKDDNSDDDASLSGFSTHYDYLASDDLRKQEAGLIRLAGAQLVRNDFLWNTIEPAKGSYDWSLYDRIVAANKSQGLQMIGMLAYSATWASTAAEGADMPDHYPPRTVSEYANFVYKTVLRYKDTVHQWEIWNEPNLDGFFRPTHSAEAYVELLKAGYLAAKRADPTATVVMSGLSGTGGGYLDEMIAAGAMDYTDAVVIHPYQAGDPEAGDAFVHDLAGVQAKAPNKPLWLTEWGWRTDEQGASNQAIYTVKGYLLADAMGVQRNALYSFNIATDTQFGLADSSIGGAVKPVYPAVAAMNHVLAELSYAGDVALGDDGVTALAFSGHGSADSVLAMWSTTAKTIELRTTKPVTIYDFYGNATTVTPVQGKVTVMLSAQPLYVQGKLQSYVGSADPRTGGTKHADHPGKSGKHNDPDQAWIMNSPYTRIGHATLTRGFDNSFSVEVYNYSSRKLTGTLELAGIPKSWIASAKGMLRAYEVQPYTSQTITFQLKPPANVELGTVQVTVRETGSKPTLKAKTVPLDIVPKLAVQVDKKAIKLTNMTSQSVSGSVALQAAAGWQMTIAQPNFELPAGASVSLPYRMNPLSGTKASSELAIVGTISTEGETIPFAQTLYVITASHAEQAPVIDGLADDSWSSAAAAVTNMQEQVSADYRASWQVDDVSANVKLMWDASKLYVFAVVKDDRAFQPQSGGAMWQGDSLQLAFDAANTGSAGYGSQVYELQIGKQDGGEAQIFKGMGFAKSGLMEGGNIAVIRDEANGTTTYELSIPFTELDGFGDGTAMKEAGFSFLVNDNDGSGREGYIEWSSGVGGAKNASQFGTLWLMQ
ncbi:sugar-binding protein [Paenibacillus sp. OV219]|uniref:sugar-binding protein n=1 Tax=Paenibacillus sp. OV219 TaxID=1884377 RepID=UPI0008B2FB68|nr:sugar-binding protein [Paenibacillus sp. OV219]SEO90867.1 Beta-galactosidase [Paenibacillus sp. OV219]